MSKEREAALRESHRAKEMEEQSLPPSFRSEHDRTWAIAWPSMTGSDGAHDYDTSSGIIYDKEPELAKRAKEMEGAMPEDTALAMHTLWNSEHKINLNGKWYVPISEVSELLTAGPEGPEPLSEEWQAELFPNLNIGMGKPIECCGEGCCAHENNTYTSGQWSDPLNCVAHIDDGTPEGKKIMEKGFQPKRGSEDGDYWTAAYVSEEIKSGEAKEDRNQREAKS